ncbi:MAG: DUF721 domain-containing protein [Deltaproteobacteria bacterium]|nr:DUF721 domain-containing protein [Deltaproteobacteria bacterium]
MDSILGTSFPDLGIEAKLEEHKIKKAWADSVGFNIAKKTAPLKLIGQTLYCAVSSSPWMTELTYQKSSIISKINAQLGKTAVTEIIFRIGPVGSPTPPKAVHSPPKRKITDEERLQIEEATKEIKDEKLKELFKRVMEKAKE